MRNSHFLRILLGSALLFAGAGCTEAPLENAGHELALDADYGKPLLPEAELAPKDDSLQGKLGPDQSADSGPMVVWEVANQWEDVDTESAREAGLAWGENSGLDWNQKYARWIESMEKMDGYVNGETYLFTTPFGRALQAPYLECAETAIFMRAAFASWYNLPFYMAAWTAEGTVFFGHFGIRYTDRRYRNMPDFRDQYADYSDLDPEEYGAEWPTDPSLAKRYLTLKKDDTNFFLGEEMYTGAYLDQVFLNKRAGHFMLHLLTYLGSIHLASSTNTYNLKADAVEEGDVLIHRWKKQGVGHTMLVMEKEDGVGGRMTVEVASGSMPRRQPKWETSTSSKYRFTTTSAGGAGISDDGYSFAALGGGIKRWRHPKIIGGQYFNVVSERDKDVFIESSNHVAIAERVAIFEDILGELPPEEKRDVLLDMIENERLHLSKYPASCAARTRREKAFEELILHQAEHFEMTQLEVELEYRKLEDFVFAELDYNTSRTCCWNSSNGAMYEAIMEYARATLEESGECIEPPVFKMVGGSYGPFETYATEMGVIWIPWSADEACPQAETVETDTEMERTLYCAIPWSVEEDEVGPPGGAGCSVTDEAGCAGCACEACVCETDSYCCDTSWDDACVERCTSQCGGGCDTTSAESER